ncbi:unnamed protein product [Mycena citricolor]|uniref:Phosphatidic acid phosphatase type 2/haloperoxidase domain-containing protein n=1 Tax=Mycena citricolor TaxID=2018698 RepID=A0AAD2Q0V1_9AGAR|nr:unnamed protein product [Mycena citricolor]
MSAITQPLNMVYQALLAAVGRLDKSFNPADTLEKVRKHQFTWSDSIYALHLALLAFWIPMMEVPGYPTKLVIPLFFAVTLSIPFTSQFVHRALPIFAWLLTYYTSRSIPVPWRPGISVSFLPTLESVMYGANISDILTRFTHPILDIIAWLPYGTFHFILPFVVAAFSWLFRPKEVLHLWARVFGWLNFTGVLIQIMIPCAPPWYEVIHGLTPANYGMKGSPGGLLRIDRLFHSNGYNVTFSNSPIIFGAFPSLHAGCATLEALFLSHFFPQCTTYIWAYVSVLYWATMYLSHHYLIDVTAGACLAAFFFYLFLPDEFRNTAAATAPPSSGPRSKYDLYGLETPRTLRRSMMVDAADFELSEGEVSEEEEDISYRSPLPVGVATNANGASKTQQGPKSHRHTASIASLIREGERGPEEGWQPSPIGATFFDAAGELESGRK